jgi:demethylmenaquinone methyltransferase/2-methoxy-6-polyprenyl-1,4-benzoquinol methylase
MTQTVSNPESTDRNADVRDGSGEMFDAIAGRYDLLNRLMSFGVDQRWRALTVRSLELPEHALVLDQATGTADLAIRIAQSQPTSRVIGVDPSTKMLEQGRAKLRGLGLSDRVELRSGRAEQLDFPDAHFDAITIAFGIRNVPDRAAALREMARVTKPGGRVAILELSEPRGGLMGPLARFHVHTLVPRLGAWLSGAHEYRYLQRSIAAFPSAADFVALMEESGLRVLHTTPLTFGVCHLYVAEPKTTVSNGDAGGA